MLIRPYRAVDCEALVQLWKSCELVRPWNDPRADIERCLDTASSTLLTGHSPDDDRLIASVMLGSEGHRGWLYYLAVHPQHRGRGHARALVAAAERWLAEHGVGKVMLMLRPENTAVRSVYERLGYSVEERILMAHWLDGGGPPGS